MGGAPEVFLEVGVALDARDHGADDARGAGVAGAQLAAAFAADGVEGVRGLAGGGFVGGGVTRRAAGANASALGADSPRGCQ